MSNSPTGYESIEDTLGDVKGRESDNASNSHYHSSRAASPVSDTGSSLDQGVILRPPKESGKPVVPASWKPHVSPTDLYFKTNTVPSDIRIDDGFYDPGRAEETPYDQDESLTIPLLTSYFDHDNGGCDRNKLKQVFPMHA